MSKIWTTEIDSDIGTLELKIHYHLEGSSHGDRYTPSSPPSVQINDLTITMAKPDYDILSQLEDEILEDEFNYDPEDYRD